MTDIYIVCVEDEPQVLDVVVRDLEQLEEVFPIEVANSANEARKLINELRNEGHSIGLILCDHIMPGDKGVDLLIEMQNDEFTKSTRKVLLTGQAGLEDTIQAVNNARLNRYVSKPWKHEHLLDVAIDELTSYVIENADNLLPYMSMLNQERLQEAIRAKGFI
ncbi:response regulator [Perlabentimonas gracilis]|uniref:response regulator n=1 Tax=Perlabentimonas gracilis TaxID=2715279 RepID=UPI00140C98E5|nr:response regulator [Perlabentimonas gracilis]NHB69116.1 response regulator [Perlabentimonas gracilis]